jgi:hypothetical protein
LQWQWPSLIQLRPDIKIVDLKSYYIAYDYREMSKKRRGKVKTVDESRPHLPLLPPDSTASPPVIVSTNNKIRTLLISSDTFKSVIEKAADRARNNLTSTGKIQPTLFFVYKDGTMKVVSLSFKNKLQKDGLIIKIREKALAENASYVLMLTEEKQEGHVITVLSGTTPGMIASARIDYNFDKETKTITLWKITCLNKPIPNVFIDDIFDRTD